MCEDASLRCCGGRGGVVRGHNGDDNVAVRGLCGFAAHEKETELWRDVERCSEQQSACSEGPKSCVKERGLSFLLGRRDFLDWTRNEVIVTSSCYP